jgi:threonine synthase
MKPIHEKKGPMYFSTRDAQLRKTASEALLEGLSSDGGLFLPEHFFQVDPAALLGKSYAEMAALLLTPYLDDFTSEEVVGAVNKAYSEVNFPERIFSLASFGSVSFLELFHGQTLTFKDMALSLLPHLLEVALKKHPEQKELRILTATSGDTGSAVLSSFASSENIRVSVLYPEHGIAPFQERQMLSFTSSHGRAYAFKGSNFDDCQTFIKKLLLEKRKDRPYSSANSINVGRLLPQIVYYYAAYLGLAQAKTIALGQLIDVVVPTGNFGDIFAAYCAKKMGLPLGKLVVASNANSVLTDFFRTGLYDARRKFVKTNSPSMDILISSNLERLLYCVTSSDQKVRDYESSLKEKGYFQADEATLTVLQKDFAAYSADEKETEEAIESCYSKHHYLLDPHTAVAYSVAGCFQQESDHPLLIVATASPLKFPKTVMGALHHPGKDDFEALEKMKAICGVILPPQFQKALEEPSPKYSLRPQEFRWLLQKKRSYEVQAPATSANLGCGFDVCGIALSLTNVFRFSLQDHDELSGFVGEEETKDNLVLKSYRCFFEEYHLPYEPVQIRLMKQGIPLSRGLGSSASCIVAGLLAASEASGRYFSPAGLLDLASAIEGHPDNVAPCLLGGFVSSFKTGKGEIIPESWPVSRELGFLLAIPEQELSTEKARSILPKNVPLADATYDAARLIALPSALREGNLPRLTEVLNDRLHVPYRLPLIEEGEIVQKIAGKYHLPFTISGAGSSLLILYSKRDETPLDNALKEMKASLSKNWVFKKLDFAEKGAVITEVRS